MKKTAILSITVVMLAAATSRAEDPVVFGDANLEAAVEATLGVTDPTPTDMLALYGLFADGMNIVDLAGIEYATNLSDLNLNDNQITDISWLSGLTNLYSLIEKALF